MKNLTENEVNQMGEELAEKVLLMKPIKRKTAFSGRKLYDTYWGTKTGIGLIRLLKSEIHSIENKAPNIL